MGCSFFLGRVGTYRFCSLRTTLPESEPSLPRKVSLVAGDARVNVGSKVIANICCRHEIGIVKEAEKRKERDDGRDLVKYQEGDDMRDGSVAKARCVFLKAAGELGGDAVDSGSLRAR